jgi:hypothetical protein
MNSTNKPILKIDWATHEAAKYACTNWHYSKSMPVGKMVKVGAWEDGKFIGVVLYSYGANYNLLKPYKLEQHQGCELTRVALTTHCTPVSRIMAIALKFLQKASPGLRLIVSYADSAKGHHGGIYQATNWLYEGTIKQSSTAEYNGKIAHKRTFDSAGIKGYVLHKAVVKHKYLMPLDNVMREKILPLAKPYPKRTTRTKEQDTGYHPVLGGVTPTRALQTCNQATLETNNKTFTEVSNG